MNALRVESRITQSLRSCFIAEGKHTCTSSPKQQRSFKSGKLLHRYTYIYISHSCKSPLPGAVNPLNNSSTDFTLVCRLFLRPVGVDGAHRLGSVRAALGLLALLVGLVDGNGVPGRGIGHALLLGGDLALLGGVGLGEARLGGRALRS